MEILLYDAVVVGSGAAGYNAAIRISEIGKKSVCLVTEGVSMGTSRNTGSDKQTYYKLGLGGDAPDSVRQMAENLFSCGSVDGDNALCEAALSARSFFHLVELGVAFPVNRYGEYVGYKTDHDPFARATSAGPLTSKFMTEALEKRALEMNIPVLDNLLAVRVLKTAEGHAAGLVCLDKTTGSYRVLRADAVVLCTGGPANIYADSVYPAVHTGSSSVALLAGAAAQNLTEWQYGLASVAPRWNVSGTYMQVLPRFVSVDGNGKEREFLLDYFASPEEALSNVFLKGYQWPFDSRKVLEGSSVVDLLVYRETVLKGRRVYLDYRTNPFGLPEIPYERISEEARNYLVAAGATFGTPIERLKKMNLPAVELYRGKGVDLETEMLEIALCAQHHNGGIAVDKWWQTTVPGLYAAGECAGTHGVTRPGGSALNAGQVGSLRAALHLSSQKPLSLSDETFASLAENAVREEESFADKVLSRPASGVGGEIARARKAMSASGGAIRDRKAMEALIADDYRRLASMESEIGIVSRKELPLVYLLRDVYVVQIAVLSAMTDFSERFGKTRGSALCSDEGGLLREGLEELFRFVPENGETRAQIQETVFGPDHCDVRWRPVRPIPEGNDFFENVWATYRENGNVY